MVSLSIVIAAFNQRATLQKLMSGLAGQIKNPKDYEVVIADDGSTDGTEQFVKKARFPIFMKYLQADQNAGRAANRNKGFARTVGKHVLFLDADMIPGPGLMQTHAAMWDSRPDEVIVGSIKVPPELRADRLSRYLFSRGQLNSTGETIIPGRYFISGNFSIKRETFEKLGGFDETFKDWGGEDTDLGLRLDREGFIIRFVPGALCYHHHPAGLEETIKRYEQYGADGYRRLIAKHPGSTIFPRGWLLGLPDSNPGVVKRVMAACISWLRSDWALKSGRWSFRIGSLSDTFIDWLLYGSLARGYFKGQTGARARDNTAQS